MNDYEAELRVNNLVIEWQEYGEESYIDAQLKKWDEVVAILRGAGIRVKEATAEVAYPDHEVQDDDKDPIEEEFDEEYYDLTCEKHGTHYPIFGFCPACEDEAVLAAPTAFNRCWECGDSCSHMFCDRCAPSHNPMR